ncbi:grpE protein homolog, mitochondrial [Cephus cinctus]|uniref:GrpE protein homolog n=1 Tax=Cephus cinctus TaxID=211228 RepID=A0AAJ7C8Q8_CEPCN|nr:grpE protein homolog, mitochondrial [Cephus cinctus]
MRYENTLVFRQKVPSLQRIFLSIKRENIMASITLPASVRFVRLAVENFYQINKNISLRTLRPKYASLFPQKAFSTATEERKTEGGETQPPVQDTNEIEKKFKTELELLNKEIAELKEFNAKLNDKYKRALADSENLRVRLTKQIEDAKLFGIQGFCKDLLEVADILGKATESVPKHELTDRNPHLKSLYEGLIMTETQLQKVFKKHGLTSVNPLNEKFDPNQHEALFEQEVEGKEAGTVVVVSKVGYKLHERIVRPALVGVAKA